MPTSPRRFTEAPLASPFGRGGRAQRGRRGEIMTILSKLFEKGCEALSATCGDSSPRGRAKGLHSPTEGVCVTLRTDRVVRPYTPPTPLTQAGRKSTPPPLSARFFVLPMARRRRRTSCTSSRLDAATAEKHPSPSFGKIFRPADDEAAQLYFVYSKPTRRWQGGKDAERKF